MNVKPDRLNEIDQLNKIDPSLPALSIRKGGLMSVELAGHSALLVPSRFTILDQELGQAPMGAERKRRPAE